MLQQNPISMPFMYHEHQYNQLIITKIDFKFPTGVSELAKDNVQTFPD